MKIIVGITGASGSIYALRLIEVLKEAGYEVHLVVTDNGWQVLQYECNETKDSLQAMIISTMQKNCSRLSFFLFMIYQFLLCKRRRAIYKNSTITLKKYTISLVSTTPRLIEA